MAIGKLLMAAPAIGNVIQGIRQNKQLKKLKKDPIPPALRRQREMAERRAMLSAAPGSAIARSMLRQSTAAATGNARRSTASGANALNAAAAADAREKSALLGLQGQNLAFQDGNQRRLAAANERYGQAEQLQQDRYNGAKAALRNARDKNFYNALTQAAAAGSAAMETGGKKRKEGQAFAMPYPSLYTDSGFWPGKLS